jgi:hypothetical protein
MQSVQSVLTDLARNPRELLIYRWNWKSALLSSLFRAAIFFFANLTAGWRAASAAMLAEFAYRACTAGFYGALTQAFRRVQPSWKAMLAAMFLLPLVSHSLEFTLHWLRGTPNLTASIIASVIFTGLSTTFNLHAMRRGIFVTGVGARSLLFDLTQVPPLLASYLTAGPRAITRHLKRTCPEQSSAR